MGPFKLFEGNVLLWARPQTLFSKIWNISVQDIEKLWHISEWIATIRDVSQARVISSSLTFGQKPFGRQTFSQLTE